jgi:hypothetical protein
MHFRDNTDRDGKQSQDVDGCTAHEVIEVDDGHEVSLKDHGRRPLSTCRSFRAFGLPPKPQLLATSLEWDGSQGKNG